MPYPTASIYRHLQRLLGGLVVILGVALSLVSYVQLNRLAEQDMTQSMQGLAEQAGRSVDHLLLPAATVLNLLANVPGLQTGRVEDWISRLPAQASVLRDHPMLVSVFVGGAHGEYLTLRGLRDAVDRTTFQAPAEAEWLVQAQRLQDLPGAAQQWLSFDADFRPLGQRPADHGEDFDPRQRPWYTPALASDGVIRTAPYTFFSTGQRGLTLARAATDGWVVGVDIRLSALPAQLTSIAERGGVRLWLLAEDGTLIASDGRYADAADPLQDAVNSFSIDAERGRAGWVDAANGTRWWMGNVEISGVGGDPLQLLVAAPRQRLVAGAEAVRNALLLATAVLTVLALLLARRSARQLSRPLQRLDDHVGALLRFDFAGQAMPRSRISELDSLAQGFARMRSTLDRFLGLLRRVAGESDLERLLQLIVDDSADAVESRHAWLYLSQQGEWGLRSQRGDADGERWLQRWKAESAAGQSPRLLTAASPGIAHALLLPLKGRRGNTLGLLVFERDTAFSEARQQFAVALSDFAALALESRELIALQKQLFDAFIQLMADAVDAKSPHTGGHCQRVPVLTEMLVELAAASSAPAVAGFTLDDELREAVHVAAWLHDCGKVATPEYVVDKATKLETLHNRIHEIRTRFEVCKREIELAAWTAAFPAGLPASARDGLAEQLRALDDDFAFVADCNVGSEYMDPARVQRLHAIAGRSWTRTLDDRLGRSHEELDRRHGEPAVELPAQEPLLADRAEHRIARPSEHAAVGDASARFTLPVPEWLYDRGELKNLAIARGTLTDEERYKINEHIVLTIRMLRALPFPRHLANVAEIAGGHHERMDGRGYPCGIEAGQLSIPARMMAIADVFEALTANDRPYKRGKTVDAALAIMRGMADGGHLDPGLFALFVQSDVAVRYADRFLEPWQRPEAAAGGQAGIASASG